MIEINGLEAVINKLDRLADTEQLKEAMGRCCAIVEKTAKEKAPRDTGALRRSITSEVSADGKELIGTVYTPLEYAPYIEYGTGLFAEDGGRKDVPWNYQDDEGNWHSTSGQQPQPFLRPALEENKTKITSILSEAIGGKKK